MNNRTLKFALAAIFGSSLMAVSFAEQAVEKPEATTEAAEASESPKAEAGDAKVEEAHAEAAHSEPVSQFADVSADHWAATALEDLKSRGILNGYPDGFFRGGRPATRYEMATAVHALWKKMQEEAINPLRALEDKVNSWGDVGAQLKELRDGQADLAEKVKLNTQDIENLKKLTDMLKTELEALKVDVDAMKKDLSSLNDRVTALEKKRPLIEFRGESSFNVLAGISADGKFGITKSGRRIGVKRGTIAAGASNKSGFGNDVTMLHEHAFTFNSTNESGPFWTGTLVFGNYLGNELTAVGTAAVVNYALGSQSEFAYGLPYSDSVAMDGYIQELKMLADTNLGGLDLGFTAGRMGMKFGESGFGFLFQRPNVYGMSDMVNGGDAIYNSRWENGEWTVDGAMGSIGASMVRLDVFGAKVSNVRTINNSMVNPMGLSSGYNGSIYDAAAAAGNIMMVDQTFGAHASVTVPDMGSLSFAYLALDTNNATANGTVRCNHMGADLNAKFMKSIALRGAFATSNFVDKDGKAITGLDTEQSAFGGSLGYEVDRFGLSAGYYSVGKNFNGPSSWRRIGAWRNPQDVSSAVVDAYAFITPEFKIFADAQFGQGVSDARKDNKFLSVLGGLSYDFTKCFNATIAYEMVQHDHKDMGDNKMKFSWITVDLGYNYNDQTRFGVNVSNGSHDNLTTYTQGRFLTGDKAAQGTQVGVYANIKY